MSTEETKERIRQKVRDSLSRIPNHGGDEVSAKRESKQWWAVTEYGVQLVTGYTCAPTNHGMWWCPEVGFSMSEGHSLFATEKEALAKAIEDMHSKVKALNSQLAKLVDRKINLPSSTQEARREA